MFLRPDSFKMRTAVSWGDRLGHSLPSRDSGGRSGRFLAWQLWPPPPPPPSGTQASAWVGSGCLGALLVPGSPQERLPFPILPALPGSGSGQKEKGGEGARTSPLGPVSSSGIEWAVTHPWTHIGTGGSRYPALGLAPRQGRQMSAGVGKGCVQWAGLPGPEG